MDPAAKGGGLGLERRLIAVLAALSCLWGCTSSSEPPRPALDAAASPPADARGGADALADAQPEGAPDAAPSDALDGPDAGASLIQGRHDVLFVGNSYVFANDVAGHYRAIAATLSSDVRVEEVTAGGYRWVDHARDARTDGTALARWLRTGTAEETSFDAVILQEQSQIGGFPENTADRMASVTAARELAALARARGAAVVLYATWGRKLGDPLNPDLFATYLAMQDRLDQNALALADLLRSDGSEVRVAPVGGGFRIVFEEITAVGGDPLAAGSDFDRLYDPDGSHPSLQGAYLAACILAGRITAADPRRFPDEPALGAEISARLRETCARSLIDPRWTRPR